jgi:predicted dehydrogenase
MRKLRVGVIGVGNMGKNHARIYSELDSCELVAVCDHNLLLVNQVAGKYGTNYYQSYKEMIEKEKLDLVTIATPTKYHKEISVYAMDNKINVLLEKPIALTLEDAQEIVDSQKKNNVKLLVGNIERFNPAIIELKKRLLAGQLGVIFKVEAHRLSPFPNRVSDVGVILDLAVHDIDLMRYITGVDILFSYTLTKKKISTEHEDMVLSLFLFENDIVGSLDINWVTPTKIRNFSVTGEHGMFVVDSLTHDLYFYNNPGISSAEYGRTMTEGSMIKYLIIKIEPLKTEIVHMVECINNKKDPLISASDAMITLRRALTMVEESSL